MMSKFKIKLARSEGEKKSKEYGFMDFPIDIRKIVSGENIDLVEKPPSQKGVSGGIIFHGAGEDVTIFYSTDVESEGFRNFTIGHELGHYFLAGHPEEILSTAPLHLSRSGFSQGASSIELEADHFSSGLLMPSYLVRKTLNRGQVGLDGILSLAEASMCSWTASAIRAAECADFPMAIIVSHSEYINYCFMSDSFKSLKPNFLRKGDLLPFSGTRKFNQDHTNVLSAKRACTRTSFSEWFGDKSNFLLDEEIIGLGGYGFTLTVLSSEELLVDPYEEDDEDAKLIESWTPKFAYGR